MSFLERFAMALPMLYIESIGAGGGSIAWLDDSGGLNVGPRAPGAHPGPACYGRGGTEPTVTDADVVLGTRRPGELPPRRAQTLDRTAAEQAIATRSRSSSA